MSDTLPDVNSIIVRLTAPAPFVTPAVPAGVVRQYFPVQYTLGPQLPTAQALRVDLLSGVLDQPLKVGLLAPAAGTFFSMPSLIQGERLRLSAGPNPGDLVDVFLTWTDFSVQPSNPVTLAVRTIVNDGLPFSLLNSTNRVLSPWRPPPLYGVVSPASTELTMMNPDTVVHSLEARRIRAGVSALVSSGTISANGFASGSSTAMAISYGAIVPGDSYSLTDLTPTATDPLMLVGLLTQLEQSKP
jgi:hypothetical protein